MQGDMQHADLQSVTNQYKNHMKMRTNNRRIKIAYLCSPKPLGKVCTAFGLLMLPVEINNYAAVGSLWHWLTTPTLVIMLLGFMAGVGLWLLKRTAIERTVTLGGWGERLYRRSRTAYFGVTMGAAIMAYVALSANCAGIYTGQGMAYGDAFMRSFAENSWMLLVMLHAAVERYTAYRQYDSSDAATRRVIIQPLNRIRR